MSVPMPEPEECPELTETDPRRLAELYEQVSRELWLDDEQAGVLRTLVA
jgi:hypothetical protein